MEELKFVEDKVASILKEVPAARNSDRLLVTIYLRSFHDITTFYQYCEKKDAPSLESITRARRKIQGRGEYLAEDNVQSNRAEEEKRFKEYSLF